MKLMNCWRALGNRGLSHRAACLHRQALGRAITRRPLHVYASRPSGPTSVQGSILDGSAGYRLQLSEGLLQSVVELPGTTYSNMQSRAETLSAWKAKLSRGALPSPSESGWPAPELQQQLLKTLSKLEMPRFCRRYPMLLDSLLKQLVQVMHEFEAAVDEADPYPPDSPMDSSPSAFSDRNDDDSQQDGQPPSSQQGGSEDGDSKNSSDPDPANQQQLEMSLEQLQAKEQSERQKRAEQQAQMEKIAEEVVEKFEEEWAPIMDGVKEAAETFDNLEGLLDGPHGFDKSRSVWKDAGWTEIRKLRKMLERVKELTVLVRSLGRSSGKGALKRAPQQVLTAKGRAGVHRSPLRPEETRGLDRSGDISRMLPIEMHLLAASRAAAAAQAAAAEAADEAAATWSPMRRLHMARRVERSLLSYERSGWLEDEPVRSTRHTEIRPSAEMGPIICCLDTSGSMHGARETVAKAVTLECMRGAYRQNRQCYLYAFGGPGEVQELALDLRAGALQKLLAFLRFSFGGGTDVDRPLEMSLARLQMNDWKQADILMVTDGEIPPPSDEVLRQLDSAKESMGLEVHALLVGRHESEAMQQLASHMHVFKSWSGVEAAKNDYSL